MNAKYTLIPVPRDLLEALVDTGDCWWDHNHSCQGHGYFFLEQGEKCPQQELKDLLEATE